MRAVFVFIGSLVVLIVGAWVLFTFVLITDEDRIHRLIQKCKRGFESGSVYSLSDVFAPGYTDKSGADKARVLQTLQAFFQATSSRSVHIYNIHIKIEGGTANVVFDCKLEADLESSARSVIPRLNELNGRRLDIRLELVRMEQRWKVTRTEVNRMQ